MVPPTPRRIRKRLSPLAGLVVASFVAVAAPASEPLPTAPQAAREFLDINCVGCHSGADAEGGLDLAAYIEPQGHQVDDEMLRDPIDTWVRMFDRVRDGEMPPPDAGKLDAEEIEPFLSSTNNWLMELQQEEAQTHGRVRGRRLTNLQLERTLHDLLGVDIPLAADFSDESRVGGFTTVADGQAMSHFQLEQHLRAVDKALDEAYRRIGTPEDAYDKKFSPEKIAKRKPKQRNREPEMRAGLAAVWNSGLIFYGRMSVTRAPADGWYRFTIKAESLKGPEDHGVWCSVRSGPCVSSAPLLVTLGGFEATETPGQWTFEGWLPKGHMIEVRPADVKLKKARFKGGQVGAGEGEPQDVPGVAMHWVKMTRIHQGPDDDGVARLLFDDIEVHRQGKEGFELQSDDPHADAARLVRRFAQRTFRRPVSGDEVEPYVAMVQALLDDGEPLADALHGGYRALLCSPRFLYFTETPGELDDHAIATRLSYMLWNRMPDDELRRLADAGKLGKADMIRDQVRRMLADDRGADFVRDFADQWLDLRDIEFTEPDPKVYRDFDRMVQQAMLLETQHYLQWMIDEDLGAAHLIDSDFTFLNSRLARFYEIEGVEGDEIRRVKLAGDGRRGGLLTHGSVLKVTANGSTTSPVLRGVWVSERLLGEHIPDPPTNVPAIEPDIRGAKTIREQFDKHTSNSSCAACHVKIDPPGFALENYDPSGKWRTKYVDSRGKGKLEVEPSHEMSDGVPFSDIAEFKRLVLRHPDRIAKGLVEHLVTYGTGAPVRFADRPVVDEIVASTEDRQYGLRSLIEAVAVSHLFLSK